jgi:hypothetical protein
MHMHMLPRFALLVIALSAAGCGAVLGEAAQPIQGEGADDKPAQQAADAAPAVAASPASASTAEGATAATKPFDFKAGEGAGAGSATCLLPGFSMPRNARLYAAGAYAGARTGFQIEQSGHEATTIKVAVNEPSAPVVLMLGAYEPTIWNVGWTRGTRIAGVLVTGYHRQQVTGLPPNVPMLVSTYDNRGPCVYGYVGGDGSSKLNAVARQA